MFQVNGTHEDRVLGLFTHVGFKEEIAVDQHDGVTLVAPEVVVTFLGDLVGQQLFTDEFDCDRLSWGVSALVVQSYYLVTMSVLVAFNEIDLFVWTPLHDEFEHGALWVLSFTAPHVSIVHIKRDDSIYQLQDQQDSYSISHLPLNQGRIPDFFL